MSRKKKKKKTYQRDGRAPVPASEATSELMSRIRGKNTKPEITFRKALWHAGLRGYRLHWKKAPGKPDIAFPKVKLALFIHGCYWHRCPHCKPSIPKSNRTFWEDKFRKNVARDRKKMDELQTAGWTVKVIWECQVKKELAKKVEEVVALYKGLLE